MKRPVAFIGFTYLFVLYLASFLSQTTTIILATLFMLGTVFALALPGLRKNNAIPMALFTITVALGSFSLYTQLYFVPQQKLLEKELEIQGVVTEVLVNANGNRSYMMKTEKIFAENVPQKVKLKLYTYEKTDLREYDIVKARVTFTQPESSDDFDLERYYRAKGITLLTTAEKEIEKVGTLNTSPRFYIAALRNTMIERIRILLPGEQGALLVGILFGKKQAISQSVIDSFADSGISHLLAVSGLHLTVIVQLLMFFFTKVKLGRKVSTVLCGLVAVFFMAMTDFTPSITRAGIMQLIYLGGLFLSAKNDSLTALGLSITLILLFNPYAATDIGLLLSIFATLGMILSNGYLHKPPKKDAQEKLPLLHRLRYKLTASVLPSAAAYLFTLPITLLTFSSIPVYSILTNLLVIPASSLILIFGFVAAIFSLLPTPLLSLPFGAISGGLLTYMQWVAEKIGNLPCATLNAGAGFVQLCLAGGFVLLGLAILSKTPKRHLCYAALLCSITIAVGILSYQISMQDATILTILSSQENAPIILQNQGMTITSGAGCNRYEGTKLTRYLKNAGIKKVDIALLPSLSTKQASGGYQLLSKHSVRCALLGSDGNLSHEISRGSAFAQKQLAYNGTSLSLGDMTVTCAQSDGDSLTTITQNGFTILIANISSGALFDIVDCLEGNLLITNGKISPYFDKIQVDYCVFSDKIKDDTFIEKSLRSKGIRYLSNSSQTCTLIIRKDHQVFVRR